MEFRKAVFVIEDSKKVYEGYTDGQKWNGFACPRFTKEVALQFLADYPLPARYFKNTDTFVFAMDPNDRSKDDEFTGVDIDAEGKVIHVYPIGAMYWAWFEVVKKSAAS